MQHFLLHYDTDSTVKQHTVNEGALRHGEHNPPLCVGDGSLPVGLTVIRCHEGNVVVVVLDIRRLSVKNGDGGNLSVSWVNLQPVGGVIHLGVPVFREREPA